MSVAQTQVVSRIGSALALAITLRHWMGMLCGMCHGDDTVWRGDQVLAN